MVFYAPVIFSSLGMGQNSSLLSSVIVGVVFVVTTVVAVLTVDKFGRKVRKLPVCVAPPSPQADKCNASFACKYFALHARGSTSKEDV